MHERVIRNSNFSTLQPGDIYHLGRQEASVTPESQVTFNSPYRPTIGAPGVHANESSFVEIPAGRVTLRNHMTGTEVAEEVRSRLEEVAVTSNLRQGNNEIIPILESTARTILNERLYNNQIRDFRIEQVTTTDIRLYIEPLQSMDRITVEARFN